MAEGDNATPTYGGGTLVSQLWYGVSMVEGFWCPQLWYGDYGRGSQVPYLWYGDSMVGGLWCPSCGVGTMVGGLWCPS